MLGVTLATETVTFFGASVTPSIDAIVTVATPDAPSGNI